MPLLDEYLPIPGVVWRHAQWELRVTVFASGSRDRSRMVARYDVRNLTGHEMSLDLVLAARPFQVNPPSQFLNTAGGVSPIRDVRWDGAALSVNGERRLFPLRAPDRVGAFAFDAGPLPSLLGGADWGVASEVHDEFGYASAALGYRLTLAPHGSATVGVVIPLSGPRAEPDLSGQSPAAWMRPCR